MDSRYIRFEERFTEEVTFSKPEKDQLMRMYSQVIKKGILESKADIEVLRQSAKAAKDENLSKALNALYHKCTGGNLYDGDDVADDLYNFYNAYKENKSYIGMQSLINKLKPLIDLLSTSPQSPPPTTQQAQQKPIFHLHWFIFSPKISLGVIKKGFEILVSSTYQSQKNWTDEELLTWFDKLYSNGEFCGNFIGMMRERWGGLAEESLSLDDEGEEKQQHNSSSFDFLSFERLLQKAYAARDAEAKSTQSKEKRPKDRIDFEEKDAHSSDLKDYVALQDVKEVVDAYESTSCCCFFFSRYHSASMRELARLVDYPVLCATFASEPSSDALQSILSVTGTRNEPAPLLYRVGDQYFLSTMDSNTSEIKTIPLDDKSLFDGFTFPENNKPSIWNKNPGLVVRKKSSSLPEKLLKKINECHQIGITKEQVEHAIKKDGWLHRDRRLAMFKGTKALNPDIYYNTDKQMVALYNKFKR